MIRGNPFRAFDTRSLLAARELILHDLTDVDENPETWQYPESSRGLIVAQLGQVDDEIARRRRLQAHPLAPRWPDARAELDDIKRAADLAPFIENLAGVRFERRGSRVWATCPLPHHHTDLTPSFCVTPEKQLWCCFGCQRGGDVFSFVEYLYDAPFAEAVDMVCRKLGVPRRIDARRAGPAREGVMRVG